MSDAGSHAAREILRDAFTRQMEHVEELTDGLTDEVALYRPTPEANSIAWLIWHTGRMQDLQVADIAGTEQVWLREGWVDRFDLDRPREAMGYGDGPDDVAKVRASADLLAGYY
ncbi:MAG: mycothiol transferase, partial [Mycolicibacterium hassiacum]